MAAYGAASEELDFSDALAFADVGHLLPMGGAGYAGMAFDAPPMAEFSEHKDDAAFASYLPTQAYGEVHSVCLSSDEDDNTGSGETPPAAAVGAGAAGGERGGSEAPPELAPAAVSDFFLTPLTQRVIGLMYHRITLPESSRGEFGARSFQQFTEMYTKYATNLASVFPGEASVPHVMFIFMELKALGNKLMRTPSGAFFVGDDLKLRYPLDISVGSRRLSRIVHLNRSLMALHTSIAHVFPTFNFIPGPQTVRELCAKAVHPCIPPSFVIIGALTHLYAAGNYAAVGTLLACARDVISKTRVYALRYADYTPGCCPTCGHTVA